MKYQRGINMEEGRLERQLRLAREEIEDWPRWMINSYGLDVPKNTIEKQQERIEELELKVRKLEYALLLCKRG
jgi:hypothetical protein